MTTTLSPAPARTGTWHALHLWVDASRDAVDRLLLEHVAPATDALVAAGEIARWFFVRYSEGGQHLRVRLDGANPATLDRLHRRFAEVPGVRVTSEAYEPEVERYGGEVPFPVAEQVFCTSTQVVLGALRLAPTGAHRLAAAVGFVLATARGLDLDATTAAAWLRSNAYSWRWHLHETDAASGPSLHDAAVQAAKSRRDAVVRRFGELADLDAGRGQPPVAWALAVRDAVAAVDVPLSRARVLGVWASQVHMTLNRLGVAPDEERFLDWLIAACLQAPARTEEFFSGQPEAPDRSYLVASRYALPDMSVQAPEDVPAPEPLFDWSPFADGMVDLPAGPAPDVDLWSALRDRRSARGPYAGPLAAGDLGTLLWGASRPDGGRGTGRHAYPSAGGQFPVRMRLAVGHVEGVRPGLYEADPVARGLIRMGLCPSPADLAATSMWFRDRPPFDERIDSGRVPAVIGLYLDLAPIRARYGQRALRFALLEAGHVAQNLALVAAATGLQLCPVGGFYDDVAHDVFLLDGVDRVLAYLLPVGPGPVTR